MRVVSDGGGGERKKEEMTRPPVDSEPMTKNVYNDDKLCFLPGLSSYCL
jgi:hypothetical protein